MSVLGTSGGLKELKQNPSLTETEDKQDEYKLRKLSHILQEERLTLNAVSGREGFSEVIFKLRYNSAES